MPRGSAGAPARRSAMASRLSCLPGCEVACRAAAAVACSGLFRALFQAAAVPCMRGTTSLLPIHRIPCSGFGDSCG